VGGGGWGGGGGGGWGEGGGGGCGEGGGVGVVKWRGLCVCLLGCFLSEPSPFCCIRIGTVSQTQPGNIVLYLQVVAQK